ncbi:hypothetical protein K456DRAFT_27910 [Colletotrichum gloeosporioides 23]|nr:hypothetical protein K456DRAFT_27910 [Colletotrichum gloeosporioides 23]
MNQSKHTRGQTPVTFPTPDTLVPSTPSILPPDVRKADSSDLTSNLLPSHHKPQQMPTSPRKANTPSSDETNHKREPTHIRSPTAFPATVKLSTATHMRRKMKTKDTEIIPFVLFSLSPLPLHLFAHLSHTHTQVIRSASLKRLSVPTTSHIASTQPFLPANFVSVLPPVKPQPTHTNPFNFAPSKSQRRQALVLTVAGDRCAKPVSAANVTTSPRLPGGTIATSGSRGSLAIRRRPNAVDSRGRIGAEMIPPMNPVASVNQSLKEVEPHH